LALADSRIKYTFQAIVARESRRRVQPFEERPRDSHRLLDHGYTPAFGHGEPACAADAVYDFARALTWNDPIACSATGGV
jgi:hypothetical protein